MELLKIILLQIVYVGIWALLPHATIAAETSARPNILVIMTDDQGWGDLSLHGNPDLDTPNIDSLAQEGVSFDRFYVSPVCSPTRSGFLTGRYHPRSGVHGTSRGGERIDLDEQTIADVLKASGYATAAFGKWHSGTQYPYHPNGRGFEEFYGFCSGHWGNYFSPQLEHNGEMVRGDGYLTDDLTNRAAEFMEQQQDSEKPFFVYLAYCTPHSPMQVPDKWWQKFKDKEITPKRIGQNQKHLDHTRAALAMCENIDWNVGHLLDKLEALEISDETLVIFLSDNGPNGPRWNGGMKGIKGSVDEGGVRSPLLVRWPGTVAQGKSATPIASAIDLLPTIAELAGVPLNSPKPLDGMSLAPLLTDAKADSADWPERMIFSHWRNNVSVRTLRYRLDPKGRLFDMMTDPGQQNDVSADHPEITRELEAAVAEWRETVLDKERRDERPFIIAHPDVPWSILPARDGNGHGKIERSSVHPNCSFFRNWTSVDDKITWNVEVGATGSYEVEIWYTCPEKDLGSTVELSFGKHHLTGTVTEAHDPPLRGSKHDRAKRSESFVKDFRPMKLGVMELEKGRGTLTLQAAEIPGSQVMDFRQLYLRRVE